MIVTYMGALIWAYLIMTMATAFFLDSYEKRFKSLMWLIVRGFAAFWSAPFLAMIVERYLTDKTAIMMWSVIGLFIYFSWIQSRFGDEEQKSDLVRWLIKDTILFLVIGVVDVAMLSVFKIGEDAAFSFMFLMIANFFLAVFVYGILQGGKKQKKQKSPSVKRLILTKEERADMLKEMHMSPQESMTVSDEKLQQLYRSYKHRSKKGFEDYNSYKLSMIGIVYFFILFLGFVLSVDTLNDILRSKEKAIGISLSQTEVLGLYVILFIVVSGLMGFVWWITSPENYQKLEKHPQPVPPFPFYRRLLNVLVTSVRSFVMALLFYITISIGVSEAFLKDVGVYSPIVGCFQQMTLPLKPLLPAELPVKYILS